MREGFWKDYAMPSELRSLASLEIQMGVVREKLAPHKERLKELGEQRFYIVNRIRNRGNYWRRKARG